MTSTPNTERVNPHHCNQCGEGEPRPTLPAKPVPPRAPAGKSRSRSALPAPGGRSAVGTELTQNWNCTGTKPAWRWYSTGHRTGTAPAHRLGQQRVWRWHRRLQHSEPRGAERRDGSRSSALARPWHSSGVVLTSCRSPAYILAREQSSSHQHCRRTLLWRWGGSGAEDPLCGGRDETGDWNQYRELEPVP